MCIGAHRGIQNVLMRRNNQTAKIIALQLPEPQVAVQLFENHGEHITISSFFGQDPLEGRADLIRQRETEFLATYPDFAPFFHTVVNNDYRLFSDGLLYFIRVSKSIEANM